MSDVISGAELAVSVDPAQVADWCAVSVIKLVGTDETGKATVRWLGGARQRNVSYDLQVKQIVKLVGGLYDQGASGVQLLVDSAGVGKSVADHIRAASALTAGVIGISMHGGERSWTQHSDRTIRASKLSVVAALQSSLETKRLTWSPDAPLANVFMEEIRNLRAKQTSSGAIKIEAKAGRHDDVLFSIAQAVFALIEGADGEDPIWNRSTVSFWDRLHTARAPRSEESEDFTLPQDVFTPRTEFDQPRGARYRFTWG